MLGGNSDFQHDVLLLSLPFTQKLVGQHEQVSVLLEI